MSPRVLLLLEELAGLLLIAGAAFIAGGWSLSNYAAAKREAGGLDVDEAIRRRRARDDAERIRLDPITEEEIARAQARAAKEEAA